MGGFFDGAGGSIAGSLIGAAGSIAGGLLGKSGGGHSYQYYLDRDYEHQKRLTTDGIGWRVQGAKAAGIHPLAALGVNTFSGSSVQAGDTDGSKDMSWLGDASQSVGRAVEAGMTAKERAKNEQIHDQAALLDLETKRLTNERIQTDINATKQDMVRQLARDAERAVRRSALPPARPTFGVDGRTQSGQVIDGQGDSFKDGLFEVKPPELMASHPDTPFAEAGSHPEVKWARTSDGGYTPVRSQALEEALEDDLLGSISWNVRNRLAPFVMGEDYNSPPPASFLPSKSHGWSYNVWKGAYYPYRRGSNSDYYRKRFGYRN